MAKTLKQEAQEFLAGVPEENVFRCHDGCVMKNMKELANELNTMTDETYVYHVNKDNNDFVNWVRDIIKDDRLAKDLRDAPNRIQAARRVASRVSVLSRRL